MNDDNLTAPAPADVADRIDGDLVTEGLASMIEHRDPELFAELMAERLSWSLEGWDANGMGAVEVVRNATGERVAGALVHWSALVRADV